MSGLQFIDPGAFRSQMSLQRAMAVPDGAGGHAQEWEEIAVLFALIEPAGAATRFGAGRQHPTVTHRITFRFREDAGSGMRLVKQARIFSIVDLRDPDETGRYLVCRARETGR